LLEEARGEGRKFCGKVAKDISFSFNEFVKEKCIELNTNINKHILACETDNRCGGCIYDKEVRKVMAGC